MQRAVIEGNQTHYVDLTSSEEAEVLERVEAGKEVERQQQERAAKMEAARERVLADPKLADLAVALGLRKPE